MEFFGQNNRRREYISVRVRQAEAIAWLRTLSNHFLNLALSELLLGSSIELIPELSPAASYAPDST
ncbi:MAG: hypothetical protein KDI01_03785, partial [Halioglobus sp.]|nr:hypothetical protein [Halioglobus sp.]